MQTRRNMLWAGYSGPYAVLAFAAETPPLRLQSKCQIGSRQSIVRKSGYRLFAYDDALLFGSAQRAKIVNAGSSRQPACRRPSNTIPKIYRERCSRPMEAIGFAGVSANRGFSTEPQAIIHQAAGRCGNSFRRGHLAVWTVCRQDFQHASLFASSGNPYRLRTTRSRPR